jgi:uncharacterized protein (DUF2267 family)
MLIERADWADYLAELSRQAAGYTATIDVMTPELGLQTEARSVPLDELGFEQHEGIAIAVGDGTAAHPVTLRHAVADPIRLEATDEPGVPAALAVDGEDGTRTLIRLHPPSTAAEHDVAASRPARLDIFDRSLAKTNVWIDEVAAALGTADRRAAYRVLRAFLHALRDGVGIGESAQLAAELPLVLRGVYYENWRPVGHRHHARHPDEFLQRVASEALLAGETEASYAVAAAAGVLRRHVSPGELDDVLSSLPVRLRQLLS